MFKSTIAAVLLVTAGFSAHAADASIGSIPLTKLIMMPSRDGHNDWIESINRATTTVDMTMFHITDNEVIKAIIAKSKSSSVKFRIITDGKVIDPKPTNGIRQLVDSGIEVRLGSPSFSITHEKGMVVDGREAFVTSINLTGMAATSRDYGVITTDAGIITEMESVFEADWKNAQDKTGITPPLSNPNLLWSPVNSKSKLEALIASAKKSLIVTVESLTDKDLVASFGQAAARGVRVQMIVPKCDLGMPLLNYPAVSALTKLNVEVRVMPEPATFDIPYMHGKMMVADAQTIYIGSVNYSYNSTEHARELGVLFADTSSANTLAQDFAHDWSVSEVPAATPDASTCGGGGFRPQNASAEPPQLPPQEAIQPPQVSTPVVAPVTPVASPAPVSSTDDTPAAVVKKKRSHRKKAAAPAVAA